MLKIAFGIFLGICVAEAVHRNELPRELRYLGWSGPHRKEGPAG